MFQNLSVISEPEISLRLSEFVYHPNNGVLRISTIQTANQFRTLIPAAVLIPMLKMKDGWHILFTRRDHTLAEHSGQVSFPGGRSELTDLSPEETALREVHEEIGVHPQDVKILGKLHEYITITNFKVTPVVGVIPWPYPLRVASEEVSRVFTIPLVWLADPKNHEIRSYAHPEPDESFQVIYFQPYDGELLWGASALFTLTLIKILLS